MPPTPSKPFNQRVSSHVLLLRTLIVTAGACAAPLAGANDATTEPAAAGALEEIVVTATRREKNISRVPISITAINQS
jgi:outer membrane cobalamin receptor